MVKGTKAEDVIKVLQLIPLKQRRKVKEVTLDMAGNMGMIVRRSFPEATLAIDRFHVQKLVLDALREIRIKHRWEALDAENDAIESARSKSIKPQNYCPMKIHLNNYWQEADTYSIKQAVNGLKINLKE